MNHSMKKPLRSPPPKSSRKKQSRSSGLPRSRSVSKFDTGKGLVMEEVKILKRGVPIKLLKPVDVIDRNGRSRSVRNTDNENPKLKSGGSCLPSAAGGHDVAKSFCHKYHNL